MKTFRNISLRFTILLLILFLVEAGFAQLKIKTGTSLTIDSATILIVKDRLQNDSAQIDNRGTIVLEGDLVNNGNGLFSESTDGTLLLSGSNRQEITGNTDASFRGKVKINNASDVALTDTETGSDQRFNDSLLFVNGRIIINDFNLSIDTTDPAGAGAGSYIQTNGTGQLRRIVAATDSDVFFPVGNDSYAPLTLRNSSTATADTFGVRVVDQEPSAGNTAGFVNLSWVVTEQAAGGSDLTVIPQWNGGDELPGFDRTNAAVGRTIDDGVTYEWGAYGPSAGGNPYTRSGDGFADVGIFTVGSNTVLLPFAHWPFDEGTGTLAEDVSPNNNDGTVVGGEEWITGKFGGGLQFDGNDNKVDAGNDSIMDMRKGDFTAMAWIKAGFDNQVYYPTILAKGAGAAYDAGYWFILRNNRLWFYVSDGTTRINAFSNVISISDSTWHHVAATVDRDGDITFYVDGDPAGLFDISVFNGINIKSNRSFTIGKWQNSAISPLNGCLDDVRLYDKVLTEMEIEAAADLNNLPVITVLAMATPDEITEGETTSLSVSAYDPDGDTLNYLWEKVNGPGQVSFTTNDTTVSDTTTASFSSFGLYTLQVSVYDSRDTVTSQVVVTVNQSGSQPIPVAHWPLDEGTGTFTEDVTVNTNDGTIMGGEEWITGMMGSGLRFDGNDNKVDAGSGSEMDMGTGDFSAMAWVKAGFDNQVNYPTILAKGAGAAYDAGYWFMLRNNRLWFYLSNGVSRINAFSDIISINDSTWNHVAATIDRDGDIIFYVNGDATGAFDISIFDGENIVSNKSFTAGKWQNSSSTPLNGCLDDIRLYDQVLTEAQIENVASLNNIPVITAAASATPSEITVAETSFLSVSAMDPDNDPLFYNWMKLSGPGNVIFTFPTENTTHASFSGPGVYTIRVEISDAMDTVSSDVVVSVSNTTSGVSPIGHWPMNENTGTTTVDATGNGNDGTLIDGPGWTSGIDAYGINFDGTDDKVDAGNSNLLDMGAGDFTVSAWIRMGQDQVYYPTIVGKGAGASYDMGYWLYVRNNRLWFNVSDGTTRLQLFSDIISVNDSSWYHISVVVDRDSLVSFYVDGSASGSADISSFDGINITSTKTLTMGAWQNSWFSFLKGDLDEVMLFDRELSSSQVDSLFNLFAANKKQPVVADATLRDLEVYPNPFTDQANLMFSLGSEQRVTIRVYDLHGNVVSRLDEQVLGMGRHKVTWKGTSETGNPVPHGFYVIRVIGEKEYLQKTVIRLK